MGRNRTPYLSTAEAECEAARKKAERFFKALLARAKKLPRKKLVMKAPAALAAVCGIFVLLEDHAAECPAMTTMLLTTKALFEAEVEKARTLARGA